MTFPPVHFSDGTLHGQSVSTCQIVDASLGGCDVLVLSLGPQERCCAISHSGSAATIKALIIGRGADFASGEPEPQRRVEEHLEQLVKYAGSSLEPELLSASPHDLHQTLSELKRHVMEAYRVAGRPLDIGIDLTSCPIFHALGLTAFALENGLTRRLSFFYAEGEYPQPAEEDGWHELFTAGDWDVAAIPGLQNPWIPRSSRRYVVSVGFEGNRTLRLCERREPDNIVVLFPDPGVRPEYAERTRSQNASFFDRFALSDEAFLRANAADAIAAWKTLSEANIGGDAEYAVEYLCCGTKPHALGLALRALCSCQGVVSDIVAEERLLTNVKSAGVYWRYDLHDLSAL